MNTFARSGAAALTAALAFTLAACGGTTSTATSTTTAPSTTSAAAATGTMMSEPHDVRWRVGHDVHSRGRRQQ